MYENAGFAFKLCFHSLAGWNVFCLLCCCCLFGCYLIFMSIRQYMDVVDSMLALLYFFSGGKTWVMECVWASNGICLVLVSCNYALRCRCLRVCVCLCVCVCVCVCVPLFV